MSRGSSYNWIITSVISSFIQGLIFDNRFLTKRPCLATPKTLTCIENSEQRQIISLDCQKADSFQQIINLSCRTFLEVPAVLFLIQKIGSPAVAWVPRWISSLFCCCCCFNKTKFRALRTLAALFMVFLFACLAKTTLCCNSKIWLSSDLAAVSPNSSWLMLEVRSGRSRTQRAAFTGRI